MPDAALPLPLDALMLFAFSLRHARHDTFTYTRRYAADASAARALLLIRWRKDATFTRYATRRRCAFA